MSYATKLEKLIAERDELRKDAERYRWLRSHWIRVSAMTRRNSHAIVLSVTGGWPGEIGDNDRLDAAIDAETTADVDGAAALVVARTSCPECGCAGCNGECAGDDMMGD